jgi:heme a synthase
MLLVPDRSLSVTPSPWPHRWAVALVCATFPMIWIGGLVTTYGAGMAVPDWPNTYGYNLFLYPLETWIDGPWKLFIEHGHRLFGTLVGLITIGFLLSTWYCQCSRLVRWLGVTALGGVLFQGALGGLRVIEDKVQLAKIHGCIGPAFFAFAVALAVVTSRHWNAGPGINQRGLAKIERVAILTTLLAYVQLVLGSQLRHLPAGALPGEFRMALVFHLVVAAGLLVHVGLLGLNVLRFQRREASLARPTIGLGALMTVQLALGAGTWISKYGWPAWFADYLFAAGHVVHADSRHQAWITTAHVATGSLVLVTSLLVALRSARMAWRGSHTSDTSFRLAEVAR